MELVAYSPVPRYVTEPLNATSDRQWSAEHLLGIAGMFGESETWFIHEKHIKRRRCVIDIAYKALMRKYHPDRAKDSM